jgi:hypothetical protein
MRHRVARSCATCFLALLLASGCLQVGTGTGAAAEAGADAPAPSPASTERTQGGSGCAEDPATRIVLCEQIDACPGVLVDQGAYPNCGFRLRAGSAMDLECFCGDALCPVGVPKSCADAKQLLSAQSALQVCQHQSDGNCLTLLPADAGMASPCAACATQCGGTPACFQACGC